jgi:hypothetical protein
LLTPTAIAWTAYNVITWGNLPIPENGRLKNEQIASMLGNSNPSTVVFGMRGVSGTESFFLIKIDAKKPKNIYLHFFFSRLFI